MFETGAPGALLFRDLLEQVAVSTVLAYLFSKFPGFGFLALPGSARRFHFGLYLFFSAMAILGTYLGVPVQGAIANSRAMGAVLAGLLGGPTLGLAVGATAGLHRYFLGGFTDVACGLSTTVEGLIGGLVASALSRRGVDDLPLAPRIAFGVTFGAECVQMLIILAVARPFADAWSLVRTIGLPMITMNAVGAYLFASVLRDQNKVRDEYGARYARLALEIAERSIALLGSGLTPENAGKLARVFRDALPVGAVAVTDRHRVLAFEGLGADHHQVGSPVGSPETKETVRAGEVYFLDGEQSRYRCAVSPHCPLNSALIVPLKVEDDVVGTIKLFEPRGQQFREVHRSFGEGVARLLSAQLLRVRLEEQRKLLLASELKLVQAQINPHFLFNALNAIRAVIRMDPGKSRDLVTHLADFLRANLRRTEGDVTLAEELEHVRAYLEIEKARYGDRLAVDVDVPDCCLGTRLPVFTLQPIVENAIKHGLKDVVADGKVRIAVRRDENAIVVDVEDNGGNYTSPDGAADGLGLSLVRRRIEWWAGHQYGTSVLCNPGIMTRVSIRLPEQV